jgi:hypothetical protein
MEVALDRNDRLLPIPEVEVQFSSCFTSSNWLFLYLRDDTSADGNGNEVMGGCDALCGPR